MNNTMAVSDKKILNKERGSWKSNCFMSRVSKSASLVLIATMFIIGCIVALSFGVPIKSVMGSYSYDVIVILVVMELFTNLIAETGIMQLLAIKIAELSKQHNRSYDYSADSFCFVEDDRSGS